MKNILCYGDSNTFGYRPDKLGQYDETVRWTALIAQALGENFRVIENGVCGRTTAMDDPRAAGRNGLADIDSVMEQYSPVDLVILMLGTNDLKTFYGMNERKIAENCGRIIDKIENLKYGAPKILLVSPILMGDNILSIKPLYDKNSLIVSRSIAAEYEMLAKEKGCFFMRAEDYADPSSVDCEHMDEVGHRNLARAIAAKVKEIFEQE